MSFLLFHQDGLAGFFDLSRFVFLLQLEARFKVNFIVVGFLGPRKSPNSFLVVSKFNIVRQDIFSRIHLYLSLRAN